MMTQLLVYLYRTQVWLKYTHARCLQKTGNAANIGMKRVKECINWRCNGAGVMQNSWKCIILNRTWEDKHSELDVKMGEVPAGRGCSYRAGLSWACRPYWQCVVWVLWDMGWAYRSPCCSVRRERNICTSPKYSNKSKQMLYKVTAFVCGCFFCTMTHPEDVFWVLFLWHHTHSVVPEDIFFPVSAASWAFLSIELTGRQLWLSWACLYIMQICSIDPQLICESIRHPTFSGWKQVLRRCGSLLIKWDFFF